MLKFIVTPAAAIVGRRTPVRKGKIQACAASLRAIPRHPRSMSGIRSEPEPGWKSPGPEWKNPVALGKTISVGTEPGWNDRLDDAPAPRMNSLSRIQHAIKAQHPNPAGKA